MDTMMIHGTDVPEMDRDELDSLGVSIPTGRVVRAASWSTHLDDDERTIDEMAAAWMAERVHLLPSDTGRDDVLAREMARAAVRRAQRIVWAQRAATPVDPITRATVGQVGALMLDMVDNLPVPSPAQVVAASVDPMAWSSWSGALEHAGTALLHAFGLPATRPDVYSRRHGQHVTRPDRVAFRGTARYERGAPCRYGAFGTLPSVETRDAVRLANGPTDDVPAWHVVTVAEYLTMLKGTGKVRKGWRGHRPVSVLLGARTGTNAARATRTHKARTLVAAIGKRGKPVGPWSASERSLPRQVTAASLGERVGALESILRTSAIGHAVTFGPVVVTVLDAASVLDHGHGRAYPIREWARRAALAGVDATAI